MIKFLSHNKWITFTFLLFIVSARLFNLNADASCFYILSGYLDQGFYLHAAKNEILFNSWIIDDYTPGLVLAPLHSLLTFLSFKLFGISFFSSRILSAFTSFITVVLCYVLCRKDKKIALISCILIGFNIYYYNYSRIGLIEPILNFLFILILIVLKNPKNNINFIFAGIILVSATMIKWTAVYFSPPLGMYLLALFIRKEIELKQILILGVTVVVLLGGIYIFYYDNYLTYFSKTFIATWNTVPSDDITIIEKIIYFFLKPTFSHPSVLILLLLCVIYACKSKLWLFFESPFNRVKSISKLELISICWAFGYSFTLLFTEFSERRFLMLIIPMAILGAHSFSIKSKMNYPLKIRWSFPLFMAFILSGISVVLQYLSNSYNLSITIIGFIFVLISIATLFLIKSARYISWFFFFCIFSLIFACLSGFLFYTFDAISFAFDFEIGKIARYSLAIIIAIVLLYLIIKQAEKLRLLLIGGYVLFGLIVMVYQHSTTTYNYYTHNLVVKKMLKPKEYITGEPHLFTVYNEVIPIRFELNGNLNKKRVKQCELAVTAEWVTHYPIGKNSSMPLSNDFIQIGVFPLNKLNKKSRVKIKYYRRVK